MTNTRRRVDWFIVITAIVAATGCGGGGCGGCASLEPIPGGFPAGKRSANATQVRVSSTALAKISADPASIIGPLVGGAMNGVIDFPVPGTCTGTAKICCSNGTTPDATCGPIAIDLVKRTTDSARLVLTPQAGASRLDVTIRARVKTKMDLPVTVSGLSCDVNIDTTRGTSQDVTITTRVNFPQDATTSTTRIDASNTAVALENADIQLNGSIACTIASAFIGVARGQLESQIATLLEGQVDDAMCKKCPSGDVAECGSSFATACTGGVCQEAGNQCLQELGVDGRARGTNLFGKLSPGTTGALDLYMVAGGYATTNGGGLALGLLGGMQPGGTPRDRCGPAATAPAQVAIAQSTFFQGNTRPDTSAAFDVALGLHKSQLGELAWAGYDGGLFCLTIGHSFAAQLSTDTLGLLSRSLGKLVEGNSPMAVGLRPQSPPTITLGKNTFTPDGMGGMTLTEPLLDIKFTQMEIDFFAAIDDQYIRVFTVVSDVHLPVGLQVSGMGELVPVIGNVSDAFTNLSVKNSDAVTESPAELAGLFPSILNLILPQLSGGLSPIALPSLGGLKLSVTDVTAVDNTSFLAIFANLVPAMVARPVDTSAVLDSVVEPSHAVASDPTQWATHRAPSLTLTLGGNAPSLEWSYRLDDRTWSAWSTNAHPTVTSNVLWLPGTHELEVRARQVGHPETIDTTPERIDIPLGTDVELPSGGKLARGANSAFHGQAGAAGCACDSSGGPGNAAPFALLLLLVMIPRRAWRRLRKLGTVVWLTALAALPGCSCGSNKCGDADCVAGDVAHGSYGRWTSIAGDDKRVLVATYDWGLGDLVVIDATDPATLEPFVVDGIPDGVTATHAGDYRKGIEDAGPDVGAWTSIAIANHKAKIAYQDREAFALKFARETGTHQWTSYTLDMGLDEDVGAYASMVIDAAGHPAVAYLAIGVDDGMGHRTTELRLARAGKPEPDLGDWTFATIAAGPGTCAGLCASGTACVAGPAAGDPESCIAPTTDCTTACATGDVCVSGACQTEVVDPKLDDLPTGTGLFVSLVVLPDGRLAAAYYDRNSRGLELAVEDSAGSNTFTESTLDAVTPGDRGMWASAVVDPMGTVHVAYQDAIGDQLMYTTWNGAPGTPQLVDDGQRAGDRTHPVGAAAAIYLANGSPAIAYQDALTADVYLATPSGGSWVTTNISTGPLLDGLSIAATTGHGAPYLAWGSFDPVADPIGSVVVEQP